MKKSILTILLAILCSLGYACPITAVTNNTTICNGNYVTISAINSGAVPMTMYTWSPGVQSGTPVVFSPTATTLYTVQGMDSLGNFCSDTITIFVINCSGEEELEGLVSLNLFPNPACERINIGIESSISSSVSLWLRNLAGQIVEDSYWTMIRGMQRRTIEVSRLPRGVYFLQIKTPQGIINRRIVLE